MLGYRRNSFKKAHALLNELRDNLSNLEVLWAFQNLLIKEIQATEGKIRLLKRQMKQLAQASSETRICKRFHYFENRIERLRLVNFVWRSFGDAIAFLYLDRFALKQTYYNTHNVNAKQGAGFLLDKEGFEAEMELLKQALSAGLPSLLVDLTNTIRHGDLCLMIGPDPYLVEVKAGSKINNRGKKQARNIDKIHQFFKDDKAIGLRGLGEIRRVAQEGTEQIYSNELNECIENAFMRGYCLVEPECGVYYLAVYDRKIHLEPIIKQIKAKNIRGYSLNEFKINRAWAPYYPFTLSIRSPEHLFAFIQGEIYLAVFVDMDIMCNIAAQQGYTAEFNLDASDYSLRLSKPGTDGWVRISEQILMRIALEFTSATWIINAGIEAIKIGIEQQVTGGASD